MKKLYIKPFVQFVNFDKHHIICTSQYGPNSEGIPVGGYGGDEEIYHPAKSNSIWEES